MGLAVELMLTVAGELGLTIMVMLLELAGFPVAQVTLEVTLQLTISPFTGT